MLNISLSVSQGHHRVAVLSYKAAEILVGCSACKDLRAEMLLTSFDEESRNNL